MTAYVPNVLMTAARMALPPSITKSRGCSTCSPRSIRLPNSALQTVLFFRGAFPQAKRMLATIRIDAQGHDDAVLGDLDAIDEHSHQVQLAEVPTEQFTQLLLSTLDKALRDRRLGRSARFDPADWFQAG